MSREFKRKPYAWGLYKWRPFPSDQSKDKGVSKKTLLNKKGEMFCDAKAHTKLGEDWFTSYVYDEEMDGQGIKHRYAYVACGYIE